MVLQDLIDVINSGNAVAIVGSGISIEAGLPSWSVLFSELANDFHRRSFDTSSARSLASKGKFPEAFDRLAELTSLAEIHSRVSDRIQQVKEPTTHHRRIADWPFKFYVTTNYDALIETASRGRLVSVGNRGKENYKLSAGIRDVVWHIHGASALTADVSQMVIAKADYDDFYPSSNTIDTLKAITKSFRCIFIGFGFKDGDFIKVLDAVGRHSNRGRPNYAFLSFDSGSKDTQSYLDELRESYNVEVVPYFSKEGDHSDLHRVLDCYAPFILRRSISLGSVGSTPDYDPTVSSLRVQSGLDLAELAAANPGLHQTLIHSRVLARIRELPGISESALIDSVRTSDMAEASIKLSIRTLISQGLVTAGTNLNLTKEYNQRTVEAQAKIALSRDRFVGSMTERIGNFTPAVDEPVKKHVVEVVANFFDELCRNRGLGVAQNLVATDPSQISLRNVALLSSFPQHLGACRTRDEAIAAIHLAEDLLSRPTKAEASYLGTLCQCYFGQHLSGASSRLSEIDLDFVTGTCYVLDSSVLACFLAEGGPLNKVVRNLVEDLNASHSPLVTTDLFVCEVCEHINWAIRLVARFGEDSHEVIDALRGKGGYRSNQFLQGFFLGTKGDSSFFSYIARILDATKSTVVTEKMVADLLGRHEILTIAFGDWPGFDPLMFAERDELQRIIMERRLAKKTFKHERQTKAEAELVIMIDQMREKRLKPRGELVKDAFFLSSTRVVDGLPSQPRRISLLPDGLAQWLWSSKTISAQHAEMVFDQLLWGLAQEGVEFVDRKTLLRRFSGVVEAARDEISAAVRDRREYLIEKYGPDPAAAFSDADPLDIPRFAKEVNDVVIKRMERAVADAEKRAKVAQDAAKMTEKDRQAVRRMRMKNAEHVRNAKKRSAQKKSGKKRGGKKKK